MDFGPTLLTHAKADARTTRRNSSGNRQKGKKMLNFGPFSPTTKESVHSFIKSTISWRYQQGSTAL